MYRRANDSVPGHGLFMFHLRISIRLDLLCRCGADSLCSNGPADPEHGSLRTITTATSDIPDARFPHCKDWMQKDGSFISALSAKFCFLLYDWVTWSCRSIWFLHFK